MLNIGSNVAGLTDTVSGRREFGSVEIYERVLATRGRTINIDTIATVSVGMIPRRFWRYVAWVIAAGFAISAVLYLVSGVGLIWRGGLSWALADLGVGLLHAAIAVGGFFVGRRFANIHVMIIGAADGSRTVFRSKDPAYLEQVRVFLTRKINEKDISATLAADFKAAVSRPIVHNTYNGGTFIENNGVMVDGDGNQIAYGSPGAVVGNGNMAVNGSGNRIGTHDQSYAMTGAAGVQIGMGNVAQGNATTYTQIDFSQMLPQVSELQRHYAQSDSARHIEQRLSELERLMHAGAATPQQKSRVRELASDLGSFFQTYPALVQFFTHIGRVVGG